MNFNLESHAVFSAWLFICFLNFHVFSQELNQNVIASCGNEYNNSVVKLQFTIGETVVLPYLNSSVQLTTGFQQNKTFPILNVNKLILPKSTIYPNPTTNFVNINTSSDDFKTFYLYDINGKILREIQSNEKDMMLSLTELPNGIYLLDIVHIYLTRETHKIILIK